MADEDESYGVSLGLSAEAATVVDRDMATAERLLAEAKQTTVELRHRMVKDMIRHAYAQARNDAINMVLFEAEEEKRADELHGEAWDLVKRLRKAQADVRRRWEAEFGDEVKW